MANLSHRIREQRWDIRVPDADTAFAVRTALRRELESEILPLFNACFDGFHSGTETVRIPKLTIHVRVGSWDELSAALPDVIRQQLAKVLESDFGNASGETKPAPRRQLKPLRERECLLHYLQHGQLPWIDEQGERGQQNESLRRAAADLLRDLGADLASLQKLTPPAVHESLAFYFRWLQLLPTAVRQEWLPRIFALHRDGSRSRRGRLRSSLFESTKGEALSLHGELHLQALCVLLTVCDEEHLSLAAVLALPGVDAATAAVYRLLPRALFAEEDAVQSSIAEGSVLGQAKAMSTPTEVSNHPRVRVTGNEADHAEWARGMPEQHQLHRPNSSVVKRDAEPPERRPLPAPEVDVDTRLWVHSAGLVLLHPYIPHLFAARQVLSQEGETIPAVELPRAAALLHWLATGRDEVDEFELSLVKVLLGLRPRDPLPLEAGLLNEADRQECTALLDAAVSHWTALRGTSVEGLQASFVQRKGLLRHTEVGWQLRVESAAFDMLLAQLPWGINIVKLGWMPKPLFTEWPPP